MPQRSDTKYRPTFSRTGHEAVIYDLSKPDVAVITVPPFSKWTSGPHWHETHTEYLQITKGKALITLGSSTWIHQAEDGVITIPKGMVHEWRRCEDPPDNEDLIVTEWTEPMDGQKEVFFRMLNSFLTEPDPTQMHGLGSYPFFTDWMEKYVITLQLFLIFATCDNWPIFFGLQGSLGWVVTHVIFAISNAIARLVLRLDSIYDEYITNELRMRVSTREEDHRGKVKR